MAEVLEGIDGYEHHTVGGLAAVYSFKPDDVAGDKVLTMLQAEQPRGVLASGIARTDGRTIPIIHSLGHVSDLGRSFQTGSESRIALGHVRSENIPSQASEPYIQPVFHSGEHRDFAFAANGHFNNILGVSKDLGFDYRNAGLPTNAAFMARLIGDFADREDQTIEDSLTELLPLFSDSPYSYGLITEGQLIAGMGNGLQPLVRGEDENGTIYVATETGALDLWQTGNQKLFLPGETIVVDNNGLRSSVGNVVGRVCVREFTDYALDFSRTSNRVEINTVRQEVGAKLAEEAPVKGAQLVLGVPERGVPIGLEYANAIDVPYSGLVIKNRYHGGTPRPTDREGHIIRVGSNYNLADPESVRDKVIVIVDNRMSTSETVRRLVDLTNDAGAKEVHLRFGTPLNDNSCEFGKHAEASMALDLDGVTSIEYLSLEGLLSTVRPYTRSSDSICTHCINGGQEVCIG